MEYYVSYDSLLLNYITATISQFVNHTGTLHKTGIIGKSQPWDLFKGIDVGPRISIKETSYV